MGVMTEPPVTVPPSSSAPATVAEPTSTPEPLPVASDDPNNPVPAGGEATPEPGSSQLFQGPSSSEPDPAAEAAKRRAAALLQAQSARTAADAFSRATFQQAETNAEVVFNGIGGVPRALNPLFTAPGAADSQGFRLGPFSIHPVVSAGINYQTTSGGRSQGTSSFYGTISPAFTLTLGEPTTGRSINMVYTGSLSLGSDSAGREPYEQSFSLGGTLSFTKLNLGFGLNFSQLSGTDRDAGGQNVSRSIVGVSLNASYTYSDKTSFSTALSIPVRLFGQGSSSEGQNMTGFVNYAYSALTTVGIGFGLGTLEVEQGSTQVFEQALTRLSYALTEKLSFSGTAGYEFRDAGAKEQITPVFGLGLTWAVRDGTSLALTGQRVIENSAAEAGANYTDTSLTASMAQRLGDSVQFTGTVGYENASYSGVERGVSSDRNDNQLILQGALSMRIKDHWVITGTVSYAKDFSNQNAFSSLQNSLQLSYVY